MWFFHVFYILSCSLSESWQCVPCCPTGVAFPVISVLFLVKHVPLHTQPQARRILELGLAAWMERVSGEQ